MNRIRSLWANRPAHRKLLVPFFTAGYPDLATSVELVRAAVAAGADMIEIGMPFSDPLADGPSIQFSSHIALQNGVNLKGILGAVADLRRTVDTPIILMGYFNPLLVYGLERFLRDAHRAGVDGLIIPDLPVDEAGEYRQEAAAHDLSTVFLVSPTSAPDRVKQIDKSSTDFVYAVTVTGVTGAGKVFGAATDTYLKSLKRVLNRPFVAGFGVSTAESARRMACFADGVVIGSALVEVVRRAGSKAAAVRDVERFLKEIRQALS